MKRYFIAALAALITLGASAGVNFWDEGTPEQKVTYGARLGLNVANLNGHYHDWDARSGLRLGAAVDWHLINSISINTGLYFSMKGAKREYAYENYEGYRYTKYYDRYSYNVLEIPVYVNYHFTVAPESSVQVFFGPYFDLGVYGRKLNKETFENTTTSTTYPLFKNSNGAHRFNCGVGLGAAYTWNQFLVELQYQWGCTSAFKKIMFDGGPTPSKWGNWNTFSITLGYNFSL
ncbi:MAG: PorT family protein [Duncaniella sp.]|nr:PorT family protein [Duncaniella sp.]